jgi:hypothetical protein
MSPKPIRERDSRTRKEILDIATKDWFDSTIEPFYARNGWYMIQVGGRFDIDVKWDALFVSSKRKDFLDQTIKKWTKMLEEATQSSLPVVVAKIREEKTQLRIKSVQLKIRSNGRQEIEVCVFQPIDLIFPETDDGMWVAEHVEDGRDYIFLSTDGDNYITGISKQDEDGNPLRPYRTIVSTGSALLVIVDKMKREHNDGYMWEKQFSRYNPGQWLRKCFWKSKKQKDCEFWYMEDKGRQDGREVWKQLAYIPHKIVPNVFLIK